MAGDSSSVSMLPWIWIIEALASDKEVEASLIHDVIGVAPQVPDDLGKNMREMVALRCLEDLNGPDNRSTNKVSAVLDSNVRFHPSESCENVLKFISGETPSNMRMVEAKELQLDVNSFIRHKRASMPKCTLQQLKDTILEGPHCNAATLKGISGLAFRNECETIPSDGGGGGGGNGLARRPSESGMDAQNDGVTRNLAPQTIEAGYKQLEKVSLNLLPSNRDRFELGADKVVGVEPESQSFVISKKRKHHDSCPTIAEDEPCENPVTNKIENGSMCSAEPQTFIGAPPKGTDNEIHQSSGSLKPGVLLKTPNGASCDESRKKLDPNDHKDDIDDCCEAEKLSNCVEKGNETIDVVMMKNQFLSSEFTLSHDSSAIVDWTKQNLCVKCHEGGQLLVCTSHGCHIKVHEKCLGSSARFHIQGKFYCPFCTYSVAIAEYFEAKRKASLARKRLAAFIGPNCEHRSKVLTDRLHVQKCNPRQGEYEDLVEIVQNGHLRETEGNQVNCIGDNVNKANNNRFQQCADNKQQSESLASLAKVILPCREEANVNSSTRHVSSNEKEGEYMIDQGCPDVRGAEGDQVQVSDDHRCDNGKLSYENREVVHVNQRCTERRIMQKETFDNENDKYATSLGYSKRRKKETNYSYPAIPQLRRVRLPFTAEEEEMIKVGVSKFSNGNEKTIPWKAILEFGADVFLKGRRTIDLKDKWRNMCRGSPKSR